MNNYGLDIVGCPGPPSRLPPPNSRMKLHHPSLPPPSASSTSLVATKGQIFTPSQVNQDQQQPKKVLSAKELTGAPLISYVPKNRKLRKKISEPLEKENSQANFLAPRQRHRSEQCLNHLPGTTGVAAANPLPNYYLGQNLYQKLLADQGLVYLQDFYSNPGFNNVLPRHAVAHNFSHHHPNHTNLRRETVSKSFDNLSDTLSLSSDESDNFIPRIIRPRRRRKKEKRRSAALALSEQEESCLGSEKQWLPTGLLSAESSVDSRSDSGSSEEDAPPPSVPHRRKLASTLSVPAYSSYCYSDFNPIPADRSSSGSDYSSMTSTSSDTPPTSPPSSSNDHLFDSDSGSTKSVPDSNDQAPIGPSTSKVRASHQPLKMTKSTSCSYFQSPKVSQKGVNFGSNTQQHKAIPLRKTNSWAFATSSNGDTSSSSSSSTSLRSEGGEFSLFSPGRSIDLLSGIRKHLSRLDLQDEEET